MLGHVSDRLGGARVALVCVLIEAVGLALIWFAPDGVSAATGAALAGFGSPKPCAALRRKAARCRHGVASHEGAEVRALHQRVIPGFAVYAATKYAVRALSEGLRQEVSRARLPPNCRTA
jgi:hypothetical protein